VCSATTSSHFLDPREFFFYTRHIAFVDPLIINSCCGCHRNAKRTLENLAAGEVELSTEDLAEIAQLLEKYPRKGARYVDGLTDQQLHLWA